MSLNTVQPSQARIQTLKSGSSFLPLITTLWWAMLEAKEEVKQQRGHQSWSWGVEWGDIELHFFIICELSLSLCWSCLSWSDSNTRADKQLERSTGKKIYRNWGKWNRERVKEIFLKDGYICCKHFQWNWLLLFHNSQHLFPSWLLTRIRNHFLGPYFLSLVIIWGVHMGVCMPMYVYS